MKKFVAMLAACAALLTGCNAASVVNHNIKAEADNFSVYRKFTAVNLRNNYYLLTVEGYLSITNDSDYDVNITIRTGENSYMLNYVHMDSEWVTYMIEQTKNVTTDPYHYEVHWFGILPDNRGGVDTYE